jgi:hypothetical protein
MPDDNQYGPDAYKRLELIKKQFQQNQAEQKKQRSAARRQKFSGWFVQNRTKIIRYALYAILAGVVIAVIVVMVR